MTEQSGIGLAAPNAWGDDFNAISFLIRQMMTRLNTMTPVRVSAVKIDSPGAVGPTGTVDVELLVSQLDGNRNSVSRGTVFGVPFFRLASGSMAFVCDPEVGDVGLIVGADRDTSSVRATRGPATPGSNRTYSYADGVYIGGILAQTPTCYVAMTKVGGQLHITMSPDSGSTYIKIEPGKITLWADVVVTHAVSINAWDVNGTGFVYTPNLIKSYTQGVTGQGLPPAPPQVPI